VELFPDDTNTRTLYDVFERSVELYGNRPYLGRKEKDKPGYSFLSYSDVSNERNALGSGPVSYTHLTLPTIYSV